MAPPSKIVVRSDDEWLEMFKEAVQMAEALYSLAEDHPVYLTEIAAHESELGAMQQRYISTVAHRVQHDLSLSEEIKRPLDEILAHLPPLINKSEGGGPGKSRSLIGSLISAISDGDAASAWNLSEPEETSLSSEQPTGKAFSLDSAFNGRLTVKSKI